MMGWDQLVVQLSEIQTIQCILVVKELLNVYSTIKNILTNFFSMFVMSRIRIPHGLTRIPPGLLNPWIRVFVTTSVK